MQFVPLSSEAALNPLHDFGQGDPFVGLYEKMDVIIHNREVPQLERELLFGENDQLKEQLFEGCFFQCHIAMVDSGGHMVYGPVL
jgi:hypothetical protein